LAAIDLFSDMLSMILQKNDGATMVRINPNGVGIRRCPLKSRNPLRNPMILINRIQARTCRIQISAYKIKGAHQKPKGASRKLTLQLLASRFNNSNKERIALFKMKDLCHQARHLALK
jgi:hypothetical protein